MKTIAIMNVKGGVGKTMTACNLAHILADTYGQRVLLIDADPQGDASRFFDRSAENGGMTELIQGTEPFYEHLTQSTEYENLDIIACDSSLFCADLSGDEDGRRRRVISDLAETIREDNAYDIILIDCPPSFTVSAISALGAADEVIVPVKLDAFSVAGMEFLLDQLAYVHKINGRAHLAGILVTMWHNCESNTQAEAELRRRGIKVFATHIRRSDKADESTWYHEPISDYSRFSAVARDYRAWVAELVETGGIIDGKV